LIINKIVSLRESFLGSWIRTLDFYQGLTTCSKSILNLSILIVTSWLINIRLDCDVLTYLSLIVASILLFLSKKDLYVTKFVCLSIW